MYSVIHSILEASLLVTDFISLLQQCFWRENSSYINTCNKQAVINQYSNETSSSTHCFSAYFFALSRLAMVVFHSLEHRNSVLHVRNNEECSKNCSIRQ